MHILIISYRAITTRYNYTITQHTTIAAASTVRWPGVQKVLGSLPACCNLFCDSALFKRRSESSLLKRVTGNCQSMESAVSGAIVRSWLESTGNDVSVLAT